MKLCLVKVVLMLIITRYKGIVDADLPSTTCSNTYPVSHEGEYPDQGIYLIDGMGAHSLITLETCQDYCNQDVTCRSVRYEIGTYWDSCCRKYSISVQELIDTGRDDEIYNETDTDSWPTYITYDRDCVNSTSNTTLTATPTTTTTTPATTTTSPTTTTTTPTTTTTTPTTTTTTPTTTTTTPTTTTTTPTTTTTTPTTTTTTPTTTTTSPTTTTTTPTTTSECTTNYAVSHDRLSPDWDLFSIGDMCNNSATPETCQDYCNQDVTCRSVRYRIHSFSWHYCYKYSMSVQELKDKGRDIEIDNVTNTYRYFVSTSITYDRDCVNATFNTTLTTSPTTTINATFNTTLTTSPTTTTVLPGAMCIYPVSYDRVAPEWEFYRIDDDFLRDDNATKETCWNYCNEDEKCRSALHIIHGDGRRYCYRFNITVQELKDSERYTDIYTETNTNFTPTYTTYDRDCGECRYPVSHVWKEPTWNYRINWVRDDTTTTKTCQDWCSTDGNCRSVTYRDLKDSRYCIKYNISVQELKDTGRDDEIYKWRFDVFFTYDRDCAAPPSTTCFNTYSVSYEGERPNRDMYRIDFILDYSATPETCQDWCTEDVACRSVWYQIYSDGARTCWKFSISVQQLKDTGRYNEIVNKDTGTIITYDKQCVESIRFMCTYEYPVSHDRQSPDRGMYIISYIRDDSATPETCWNYCNQDVTCRSVKYVILGYMHEYDYEVEERSCIKFNISIQQLKDTGRYNEIYNETDTDYTTYITYDRDCVEVSPATKGPGTDGDEVSPATKGPGTNAAAIGERMIVLIVMIGAGAVFVAPMIPGAEVAF